MLLPVTPDVTLIVSVWPVAELVMVIVPLSCAEFENVPTSCTCVALVVMVTLLNPLVNEIEVVVSGGALNVISSVSAAAPAANVMVKVSKPPLSPIEVLDVGGEATVPR
jgi:hypothetical protein